MVGGFASALPAITATAKDASKLFCHPPIARRLTFCSAAYQRRRWLRYSGTRQQASLFSAKRGLAMYRRKPLPARYGVGDILFLAGVGVAICFIAALVMAR